MVRNVKDMIAVGHSVATACASTNLEQHTFLWMEERIEFVSRKTASAIGMPVIGQKTDDNAIHPTDDTLTAICEMSVIA